MMVEKVFGDRALGGYDFDILLCKYIKNIFKKRYPEILIDSFLENQINIKAEEIKFQLTVQEEAKVIFSECYFMDQCETHSCYFEMNRNDFRIVTKKLNAKIERLIMEVKDNYLNLINKMDCNNSLALIGRLGCKIFTVQEIIKKFSVIFQ